MYISESYRKDLSSIDTEKFTDSYGKSGYVTAPCQSGPYLSRLLRNIPYAFISKPVDADLSIPVENPTGVCTAFSFSICSLLIALFSVCSRITLSIWAFLSARFSATFSANFSFSSRFFLAFNRRSSSSLYFFCILVLLFPFPVFAVLMPPQDDCLFPLASYVIVLPPSTTPSLCAHP